MAKWFYFTWINFLKPQPTVAVFSLTEMWERYGFYVVQSLLALYLISHYGLMDIQTYRLVGSFTALTYVSPIIGGLIADKWLGQKNAVRFGAVLLAINYLLLALNISFFMMTFALAGISVGTGLLKPNISSLLGNQYRSNCPERERGFILFYMGITAGIILGTTMPTVIYSHLGWSACFLSATIGLCLALVIFSYGVKRFCIQDYRVIKEDKTYAFLKSAMLMMLFWNVAFIILSRPKIAFWFFSLVIVFSVTYIMGIFTREKGAFRKDILAFLLLCVVSVFYWAFYFQMFLSLTLFITRAVQPSVLGFHFPAPYYVAVESFAMLGFGLLFMRIIPKRKSLSIAESTAWKFSFSMGLMLVAYGLIYYAMRSTEIYELVSPCFIILAYVIIAASELLLSPVGLSAVTELSKPRYVSTLTGVFFISLGLGGYLSGALASIASLDDKGHTLTQLQLNYQHAFYNLSLLLAAAFAISVLIACVIRYAYRKP